MTESDWLSSTDPTAMLEFLRGKASGRKLRLFAAACARRHCHIFESSAASDEYWRRVKPRVDAACQGIITVVEDDEGARSEVAVRLRNELEDAPLGLIRDITATIRGDAKYWLDRMPKLPLTARQQGMIGVDDLRERVEEQDFQLSRLRCLFSPFAIPLDPRWRTPTVLSLGQGIYADRAFDRLPILADALADAGCDAPALMGHCRSETVHARGCWAVDLVLGRE